MEIKIIDLAAAERMKYNIDNMFPIYINKFVISVNDWSDKKYTLRNASIKENSIINIYFNESSKDYVQSLSLSYSQGIGYIEFISTINPTSDLTVDVIEIVNPKGL